MKNIVPDSSEIVPLPEVEGNTQSTSTSLAEPVKKKQISGRVHHFFTYNNYNSSIIPLLESTFKQFCYMYCFQEERGENGTPHLQGIISCKKKMRDTEFGLPKQIHWEAVKCLDKGYSYCCKEETRIGSLYYYGFTPPKKLDIIEKNQMTDWMLELEYIIQGTPDKRKVHWYWSEMGGIGKSSFCKYLVHRYNAVFIDEGKKADIMNTIMKADMNKSNIVVIDIPRDNGNNVSYKSIEAIKNGMIYCGKYEGGYKLFNSPHLIVFCNYAPDRSKLSDDRWVIKELKNENITPNIEKLFRS